MAGDLQERLATNLRLLRLARDLTQEELADRAQLNRSYIGGIERGNRNLTLRNLEKLARALEADAGDLLKEPPK